MVTLLAFNTCKTIMEDPVVKITINDLSHVGSEKAILLGKALVIDLFKHFKMIFNTLILRGRLRFSRPINGASVEHGLFSPKQDKGRGRN